MQPTYTPPEFIAKQCASAEEVTEFLQAEFSNQTYIGHSFTLTSLGDGEVMVVILRIPMGGQNSTNAAEPTIQVE